MRCRRGTQLRAVSLGGLCWAAPLHTRVLEEPVACALSVPFLQERSERLARGNGQLLLAAPLISLAYPTGMLGNNSESSPALGLLLCAAVVFLVRAKSRRAGRALNKLSNLTFCPRAGSHLAKLSQQMFVQHSS